MPRPMFPSPMKAMVATVCVSRAACHPMIKEYSMNEMTGAKAAELAREPSCSCTASARRQRCGTACGERSRSARSADGSRRTSAVMAPPTGNVTTPSATHAAEVAEHVRGTHDVVRDRPLARCLHRARAREPLVRRRGRRRSRRRAEDHVVGGGPAGLARARKPAGALVCDCRGSVGALSTRVRPRRRCRAER